MIFNFKQHKNQPAIIDGDSGQTLTYEKLAESASHFVKYFEAHKSLVFLFVSPSPDILTAYLALLNQGHAVAVFDTGLHPDLKNQLVAAYIPHYIIEGITSSWAPAQDLYAVVRTSITSLKAWRCNNFMICPRLHPDLQLLLSTSGTTGSPKLIRLSASNLVSNASAICNYLGITDQEKAIATLPFHYSYGLSILHTHLMAGATLVLTKQSVVQEDFWKILNHYKCTSMAGVPYTYQLLDRLGIENLDCPSLRTLTQAGGRLSATLIARFHAFMQKRKGRFFVMYGQTEATARIAYLPVACLPAKSAAIGIPIPGGKLQLFDGETEIKESHQVGELVYSGPNVMLGYAAHPQDLAKGDELHGRLHTGDIGYRDEDGVYFLTGRIKRISKLFGQRINLEEIERGVSGFGHIAATSDDTAIRLYYEKAKGADTESCINFLISTYHLAPTTIECIAVPQFPLTASGKIDYTRLK